MAAGSETAAETYAAIRALLARLGDHHSFLMRPQGAAAFRTGGAENARPQVRVQTDGIGYISVPRMSGSTKRLPSRTCERCMIAGSRRCEWRRHMPMDSRLAHEWRRQHVADARRPAALRRRRGTWFIRLCGGKRSALARARPGGRETSGDPCTAGVGECCRPDGSANCEFRGGGHDRIHWPAADPNVRLADGGTVHGERHAHAARQRDDTVDDGRRGGSNGQAIWREARAG